MGVNASRGWDNQSLMDKMIDSDHCLPQCLERSMRLVDRGEYFEERSHRAYMDLAWRSGCIHLSAPSIYITALGNLDLSPGQSFLNIGSGSGYLSTVVGLILGYNGVNHGIELNENSVSFAEKRLASFLRSSDAPCERDFCIPQFLHGNIFDLVLGDLPTAHEAHGHGDHSESDADEQEDVALFLNNSGDSFIQTVANSTANEADDDSTEISNQSSFLLTPDEPDTSQNDENQNSVPGCSTDEVSILPSPSFDANLGSEYHRDGPLQWPTYDRIYVGAAVRSPTHLNYILRLLKVNGVLIAPVQDELVKITRLAENRISRNSLLSVSFAPLIFPQPGLCNRVILRKSNSLQPNQS